MSTISTTTTGLTASRIEALYQKKLLQHAIASLQLAQIVEKFDLPQKAGSLTMRFFKRSEASASTVQTLTEETPINTFSNSTLTPIDVTLAQFGEVCKITDTRLMTDLLNQLDKEVERMGEAAALHLDTQIRDVTVAGVTAASQKRYAQGLADFAALKAATASAGKLTVKDLARAKAQLKNNRAPLFGKDAIAVVCPNAALDLQDDPQWRNVQEYQNKEAIFNGEIGKIAGCRVVEATNPFREGSAEADAEGTFKADGDIFTAMVFGKEAVGTVKLAGTNSPMKPQFIYNDKADKSDPLNQYVTAGWKGWYASKVLDQKFVITLRHKTTA